MATIIQVINHKIRTLSDKIRNIRNAAFSQRMATKWMYVHKETGQTMKPETYYLMVWKPLDKKTYDYSKWPWEYKTMPYEKVMSCVSPKHPSWSEYQRLKREVSVLLTAKVLVKFWGELVPSGLPLRNMLRAHATYKGKDDPFNIPYASPRARRSTIIEAARRVRRIANKLEKNPGAYPEVDQYAASIEAIKGATP